MPPPFAAATSPPGTHGRADFAAFRARRFASNFARARVPPLRLQPPLLRLGRLLRERLRDRRRRGVVGAGGKGSVSRVWDRVGARVRVPGRRRSRSPTRTTRTDRSRARPRPRAGLVSVSVGAGVSPREAPESVGVASRSAAALRRCSRIDVVALEAHLLHLVEELPGRAPQSPRACTRPSPRCT